MLYTASRLGVILKQCNCLLERARMRFKGLDGYEDSTSAEQFEVDGTI